MKRPEGNEGNNGKAQFLVTTEQGDIEIGWGVYNGCIPRVVIKRFTRYILKQSEKGVYFPVSPMDIYQVAFPLLEKRAATLPPDVCDPIRYLTTAGRLILLKLRNRIVLPKREEYRAIEGRVASKSARPSAGDVSEHAISREMAKVYKCEREQVTLSAYDLAESLPAAPDAAKVYRQALDCLKETMPKLKPETRRAFQAWIDAQGIQRDAAEKCGESRFKYARLWPERCREFRRACTWVSVESL